MRTLFLFLFAIVIAVFIIGCGGGAKTMQSADTGDIPDWFSNVPSDPNYFYAPNTQVSQDLQLAIDKATQGGRTEVGRMVETKVNGLQKRFTEETGTANNAQLLDMFTSASKTIVSTSLSGSRVAKQKTVKDGNNWRAYVLVEYPVGAANQALMQQIKNNEQMYTKFRASQVYKELDDEVQKYEDWKKAQNKQ
ncbi:MAG: hypothetical protein HYZ01_10005 [Ignavibacteriales bacterium]|nr:hypothetical protein [Ignavibacteriales bacterium]